ncbi:MAG TPA: glycosyltransferase family 4 protein [Vicinamibacteria bacterium]|nr:glycosyltransferase family 4 protein [Vicinamibacteria bacterium]
MDTAAGWRGGQNQVLLTALGMRERGHDVLLACRKGGALEARALRAGLEVRAIPFRGDAWPPAVAALARLVRQARAEVAHLHDPHAVGAGVLAATVARRRPPLVATRRVDFPLRGPLSRWKYRSCDAVIAVSRAVAEVLAKDGVSGPRVHVVYEGVPERAGPPGGQEALAAIGVPPGSLVVGNVAALTDHKDHGTLLEAAAAVVRRLPQACFVIFGEGERRRAIEARAAELGLASRWLMAGFREDLDRLIPCFAVFCLSSRLEGLGTSLLDAMCFGVPVVATAAGGIAEAVEDGVTGRLAPVGDPASLGAALVEVLGDPGRRARLGEAARERFRARFTASRMVEETLRVYGAVS